MFLPALEDIKKEARGKRHGYCNVRTHPQTAYRKGSWCQLALNPGSTSYPRQDGSILPSYIVMEIDANGYSGLSAQISF